MFELYHSTALKTFDIVCSEIIQMLLKIVSAGSTSDDNVISVL